MTIFGSDVSHYDAPDTRPMLADGIVFQTHKAGGDANDGELGQWWTYVRGHRDTVLLGAYWVLRPGSPVSSADAFIARLDSQCPGWRDEPFILQADCEKWGGDPATVPPVSEINAFCDRLRVKVPKLMPIGYLPKWVYGDKVKDFRYPLWASAYVIGEGHYRDLYPGDASSRWAAYGGKTPAVLQYTSSAVIANQTTCDANAYRGTLAELTNLLAPGWKKEDLVVIADTDAEKIADKVWGRMFTRPDGPDAHGNTKTSAGAYQSYNDKVTNDAAARVIATLTAVIKGQDVDEAAIAAGVLAGLTPDRLAAAITAAGLTPEALVAAIPADLAEQVLDGLGARIRGQ
jgi:hypothetical protein